MTKCETHDKNAIVDNGINGNGDRVFRQNGLGRYVKGNSSHINRVIGIGTAKREKRPGADCALVRVFNLAQAKNHRPFVLAYNFDTSAAGFLSFGTFLELFETTHQSGRTNMHPSMNNQQLYCRPRRPFFVVLILFLT